MLREAVLASEIPGNNLAARALPEPPLRGLSAPYQELHPCDRNQNHRHSRRLNLYAIIIVTSCRLSNRWSLLQIHFVTGFIAGLVCCWQLYPPNRFYC